MTQEEKQLLLIDLSSRLPYHGLICQTNKGKGTLISVECSFGEDLVYVDFGRSEAEEFDLNDGDTVKPYLRPMSSMTEEEKKEHDFYCGYQPYDENIGESYLTEYDMPDYLDFLYEHHLDFRGLIPMGLAIEAKEGMYKTE